VTENLIANILKIAKPIAIFDPWLAPWLWLLLEVWHT
jgi:hypothetical protein